MRAHNRRYTTTRTIYVDATAGADTNGGASPDHPKQTSAAINALTGSVLQTRLRNRVLFKRGETWKTQLLTVPVSGNPGKPIFFGAYGSGNNPLFDPTQEYNDFTLDSGAIWKRTHNQAVYQVFMDGVRMIYEPDKASMVAGSYAYVGPTLYVWAADSGDPNTGHATEVCADANGSVIKFNGKSNLIFDSIDVTKHTVAAYVTDAANSNSITIRNCTVSWAAIRSILIGTDGHGSLDTCSNITISNCTGHDDNDHSFWMGSCTNGIIENCTTYNSGKDVAPQAKNYPLSGAQQHWPDGILVSAYNQSCIVRNNHIYDIYGASAACIMDERSGGQKGSDTIIEGNLIDSRTGDAYGMMIAGIRTIIRNNIIYHDGSNAIMLVNAPTTPAFYHNTFISSGTAHSVDFSTTNPGVLFKNNIIIRTGGTGRYISIPATSQAGTVVDYNLYYGSSTQRWFWGPNERTAWTGANSWVTTDGQDAHGVNADPVFVTPNTDLHLQTTSPAKNAAVGSLGVNYDYDQNPRPYGAANDIGAYERQAA